MYGECLALKRINSALLLALISEYIKTNDALWCRYTPKVSVGFSVRIYGIFSQSLVIAFHIKQGNDVSSSLQYFHFLKLVL